MRHLALVALLVVSLSSCAGRLGAGVPECDIGITSGIIIQVQAVPSAALVPCIASLPTGWDYDSLQPRSGRAEFFIDSDRMGTNFLKVRTQASCDATGIKTTSMDSDVELYKDVQVDLTVPIVFIAEGPSDETIAAVQDILRDLVGSTFNGRRPEVTFDQSEGSTSDRIRDARASNAHVLVVGLREAEERTVSLILAGQAREVVLPVAVALDRIEEVTPEPAYRGSWYYLFDGGCTEYEFDAAGDDTLTISRDADASLSFVETAAIKQAARDAGYHLP